MKIKTKMLIGGALLATLPVLLSSLFIGYTAVNKGKMALEEDARSSLVAIRDITASQIQNYFTGIEQQSRAMSENLMTREAMQAFSREFLSYASNVSNAQLITQKESLEDYYRDQFGAKYNELNGKNANISELLNSLSANEVALQYQYISNNQNPLGSKQLLNAASTNHPYDNTHAKYHEVFASYIERFGFYDLFLVDHNTGNIVYSVFKELDYATSLISGPYADSGIGQAFKLANAASEAGFTGLTDFAPYVPSYSAPASFIGSPIYDNGQKIGILILQMPVDRINDVMTYSGNWKESGLGDSGETYLVGADFMMRSNGRFLLEDKQSYLQLMQEIGLSAEQVQALNQKETSIGLQPVKTQGTVAAISGKKGFDIFEDYRNVSVLSAYMPITIGGLQWAIMSEIDEEEAFRPVQALRNEVFTNTIIAITISTLLGMIAARIFSQRILAPILEVRRRLHSMADGKGDLTQRINVIGSDETSDLALSFNSFVSHLDTTFSDLIKSAMRLIPMSKELGEGNEALMESSNEQNRQLSKMRDRLYVASDSTDKVREISQNISEGSDRGAKSVESGLASFRQTETEINTLGTVIDDAGNSIDSLKAENDRIVSVIDVISSIADQTNLLALNAAIEAARAGEAGRGFAVVADEVRALASRTRESTLEVSSMVEAIQSKTDAVVQRMEVGKETIDVCNTRVNEAKTKLQDIETTMGEITNMVDDIGQMLVTQRENFDHVGLDFNKMDQCFHDSQEASHVSVQIGIDMNKLSTRLNDMVSQFDLSDKEWDLSKRTKEKGERHKLSSEELEEAVDDIMF
jgi:methyl-accepting chemotaxis protein